MANNIKISSATDNMERIKVRSTNVSRPVQATSVEASHYADIAEDYAGRAQESASIAKEAEQNAIIAVENISTLTSDSLNSISNATTEALSDIDDASAPVFEHLDTVKVVSDNISNVLYVANNVDTILNKTLEIGTVTTTEAGTNATIVNSGTQYNPVLDFTIPKGDQGVKGDDGGMDATYDEETKTLSFYNESGTVLHPQWGGIEGDITHQSDLQATLNMKANKDELDNKQDKGNYALKSEIPNISNLATKSEVTQGLDTKQDKGDYATRTELSEGLDTKQDKGNYALKSEIPNISNLATKDELPTQVSALENDSNYATQTQVMQAIASIPQFSLSIVEALPTTGEKMTLYLVSKGTESPDVYDEYIWIEETSSFEFLGTTAVDLTDYVKNTDYATTTKGGVVKLSSASFGVIQYNGYLQGYTATLEKYNEVNNPFMVCKGTLENIKNNYVKEAVTTNDIELTDDEKTSARTWLGAVGNTDYATSSKGGVIVSSSSYGAMTSQSTGYLYTPTKTLAEYNSMPTSSFIGKGTLENVLNARLGDIETILDEINGDV